MRANFVSVMFSISVYGMRYSSLYILLLTPSSVPDSRDSMSITSCTPLLWVSPTALSPYSRLASSACWKLVSRTIWLSHVPMWTVELPVMVLDSGTPLSYSPINVCSDTGFRLVDTLTLCDCFRFRSFIPSLSLWLTIRHPFGFTQLVASLCAKFRSGLVVSPLARLD